MPGMTTLGPTPTEAAAPGPLAPLGLHDFRLLFLMQLVSGIRWPMQIFAQSWYVNTVAPEDQRLLLGLLSTLQGLAYLGYILFGGALVMVGAAVLAGLQRPLRRLS